MSSSDSWTPERESKPKLKGGKKNAAKLKKGMAQAIYNRLPNCVERAAIILKRCPIPTATTTVSNVDQPAPTSVEVPITIQEGPEVEVESTSTTSVVRTKAVAKFFDSEPVPSTSTGTTVAPSPTLRLKGPTCSGRRKEGRGQTLLAPVTDVETAGRQREQLVKKFLEAPPRLDKPSRRRLLPECPAEALKEFAKALNHSLNVSEKSP